MISMKNGLLTTAITCLALLMCVGQAMAQGKQSQQGGQQQMGQQKQQGMQGQITAVPEGYVGVAYDLNNDGVYETYEVISVYDLNIARQQSAQRLQAQAGQQGGQGQQGTREMGQTSQAQPGQQQMQTRQQAEQIQGTIQELRTIDIQNTGRQEIVAKIKTQEGRMARVSLGPKESLQQLGLKKGDQLTIQGRRGTINQQPYLFAERIQAGGQQVQVQRQQVMALKRFDGQIQQTKTVKVGDAQHLLASIRLDNGQNTLVNLGSVDDLQQANLRQGQQVKLLAKPVTIQGKTALLAKSINVAGQNYDVNWSKAQQQIQAAQGQQG